MINKNYNRIIITCLLILLMLMLDHGISYAQQRSGFFDLKPKISTARQKFGFFGLKPKNVQPSVTVKDKSNYVCGIVVIEPGEKINPFLISYHLSNGLKNSFSYAKSLQNQFGVITPLKEIFIPASTAEVTINCSGSLEVSLCDNSGFFLMKIPRVKECRSIVFKCKHAAFVSSETNEILFKKDKNYLLKIYIQKNGKLKIAAIDAPSFKSSDDAEIKKAVLKKIEGAAKSAKKLSSIRGRAYIPASYKKLLSAGGSEKNRAEDDFVKLILVPDNKDAQIEADGFFKFTGNFYESKKYIRAKLGKMIEKTFEVNVFKGDYGFGVDGIPIKFNTAPVITNIKTLNNSKNIEISYDIFDADGDSCDVKLCYSIDGGSSYRSAKKISGNMSEISSGASKKIIWNSLEDFNTNYQSVRLAMYAFDRFERGDTFESSVFAVRNNERPVVSNVSISALSDEVKIRYDLSDADGDTCTAELFYSLDNGMNYVKSASLSGDFSNVLPAKSKILVWRSREDFKTDEPNVKIKLIVRDKVEESLHYMSNAMLILNNFERPVISIDAVNGNSNEITILYNLADGDDNKCLIEARYSSNGKTFKRTSNVSGALLGVKPGKDLKIIWNSRRDFMADTDEMYFELAAYDGVGYGKKAVAGPFKILNNRAPYVNNIYPIDSSGEVSFYYDVIDEEFDTCSVDFYYSLDNGLNFIKSPKITGEIAFIHPGIRKNLKWKTRPELMGNYSNVKVKIVPYENEKKYGKESVSPPFALLNNRPPGIIGVKPEGDSGEISVEYDIIDADNSECSVEVYFSTDGGKKYKMTKNVSSVNEKYKPGRSKKVVWRSNLDFHTSEKNVVLKILPRDNFTYGYEGISSVFTVNNNEAPVVSNISCSGESGEISIVYDMSDLEGNLCDVKLWYSLDGGHEFIKSAAVKGDIESIKPASKLKIEWNSRDDFKSDEKSVLIKLVADDGNMKSAEMIFGPMKIDNNRLPYLKNVSVVGESADIIINYELIDDDFDECSVEVFLSKDASAEFKKTVNVTGDLKKIKSCGLKSIKWNSASDFSDWSGRVSLKLVAYDKFGAGKPFTSDPFTLKNSGLPVIENINVVNKNGAIEIKYDISAQDQHLCTVEVYYSQDGIEFFEMASAITGDAVNVSCAKNKKILWDSVLDLMINTNIFIKLSPIDSAGRGCAAVSKKIEIANALNLMKLNSGFSARESQTLLNYNDRLFIIGGWAGSPNYYSDIAVLKGIGEDSVEISVLPNQLVGVRHSHSGAVYDNKLWVIGGFSNGSKNDVWYSTDGAAWVEITKNETESVKFTPRDSQASITFNDGFGEKLFVIGGFSRGYRNDVWCSVNGAQWTSISKESAFSPRVGHSAVVFKNKMWIIGGYDGEKYKNDVWSSIDGIRWEPVVSKAGFAPRRGHATVIYKGRIWVIGGYGGENKYYNDIWVSEDGVNWKKNICQSDASSCFTPRRGHCACVYRDKIWILGGYDGMNYCEDLWRSR